MDNYYANIAWTIDAIILILIGLVSAAIIVYALISEQYFIRRKHDLMTIKNNLKNWISLDSSFYAALELKNQSKGVRV